MALTKATYSMIQGAVVNVLDFGADPTGVADSTAAIQAAINSINAYTWQGSVTATEQAEANNNGGEVFFPVGRYRITDTILLNPFVMLNGVEQTTEFKQANNARGSGSVIVADFANPAKYAFDTAPYYADGARHPGLSKINTIDLQVTITKVGGVGLRNLTVYSPTAVYGGARLVGSPGAKVENCVFEGFVTGILTNAGWHLSFVNNMIKTLGVGIALCDFVNQAYLENNYINMWPNNNTYVLTATEVPYFDAVDPVKNPSATRFQRTGIYMTQAVVCAVSNLTEHWDRGVYAHNYTSVQFNTHWMENISSVSFEGSDSKILVDNAHFFVLTDLFRLYSDGVYTLSDPDGTYGLLLDYTNSTTNCQLELRGAYPKAGDNLQTLSTQFNKTGQSRILVLDEMNDPVISYYIDPDTGNNLWGGIGAWMPLFTIDEAFSRMQPGRAYNVYIKRDTSNKAQLKWYTDVPPNVSVAFSPYGTGSTCFISFDAPVANRLSSFRCYEGSSLTFDGITLYSPNCTSYTFNESKTWFNAYGSTRISFINCNIQIGAGAGLFGNEIYANGTFYVNMKDTSVVGYGSPATFGVMSISYVGSTDAFTQIILMGENSTVNASCRTWAATTSVLKNNIF